jgi:hypothetical protein
VTAKNDAEMNAVTRTARRGRCVRGLHSRAIGFFDAGEPYDVLRCRSYALPSDLAPREVRLKIRMATISPPCLLVDCPR